MQFGLFMMPLHPPYRSYADSYDRDLDLLVKADQLGYTEAWIGEHVTERWENAPCPDLLIAKASAMTENIMFGTGADRGEGIVGRPPPNLFGVARMRW